MYTRAAALGFCDMRVVGHDCVALRAHERHQPFVPVALMQNHIADDHIVFADFRAAPIPMVENIVETHVAPIMVVIAVPARKCTHCPVHAESRVDNGLGQRHEPPELLFALSFAIQPVSAARTPHRNLGPHNGVVGNRRVFITDMVAAVFLPTNEAIFYAHIARIFCTADDATLFALNEHVDALAVFIRDLEINSGPCGARNVEIVLREENHHNSRAVFEGGIGIPPLKRALAAVRAQRVLARRRAIPYDVESFEIGIRIGKTRNLRRAHIYSNLYEIPNQTAQRKSAYTSFTSKFVAAAASSSRASFASSSTARTSSSMCCASCSF